jgi:NADH:ubiquinone oxidoreductase subunit H
VFIGWGMNADAAYVLTAFISILMLITVVMVLDIFLVWTERKIVARFQELGVEKVGATHCTGEKAIEAFRKAYGARFIEMGAGRVVELP